MRDTRSLMSVGSGTASHAAIVNAFVAADTKRSWKGMAMAAGGSGGGVFQQFRGRDTRLTPPHIHYSNSLSVGDHTPPQQLMKKRVTYLIMTAK